MQEIIRVEQLSKSYSGKMVLHNLGFSVEKGKVLGLLGANGAGKSTSLECILGTKKKDSGEISILGLNPIEDRRVLFQKVMKTFKTMLKTEAKLSIRDMNMVIFAIIMPAIVLVMLGIVYSHKPATPEVSYTFLEQLFGALCSIAICAGGLMGLPMLMFSGATLPYEVMPEGMLVSMQSISGEPVCLWLPVQYQKPNTSEYVQGVEVPVSYDGIIPDDFDVITLPEADYLMFQGEPFEEKEYCQAIEEVKVSIQKFNPDSIGYMWDQSNPRIQLEPVGTWGYIELVAVKAKR